MRKLGTEGGFQDRVKKALKEQGAFVRKINSGKFGSGMPDLVIVCRGITAFTEVKKEGETLTSLQRITMKSIARSGGLAIQLRINQQEGCDISYMSRDGDLCAVSTCTLKELVPGICIAALSAQRGIVD